MKRSILAVALFCFAVAAQALDYTITLTAGEATRIAAAVGKVYGLVDAQVPPQPRSATAAEVKKGLSDVMKQWIQDTEGTTLRKQAVDAVVVPAFDPK